MKSILTLIPFILGLNICIAETNVNFHPVAMSNVVASVQKLATNCNPKEDSGSVSLVITKVRDFRNKVTLHERGFTPELKTSVAQTLRSLVDCLTVVDSKLNEAQSYWARRLKNLPSRTEAVAMGSVYGLDPGQVNDQLRLSFGQYTRSYDDDIATVVVLKSEIEGLAQKLSTK